MSARLLLTNCGKANKGQKMQIVTNSTEEFVAALDRIKREGRRIVSAERAPGGRGWTITATDMPIQQTKPFSFGKRPLIDSVGSRSPGGFGRI
jgi:hypothetical protein